MCDVFNYIGTDIPKYLFKYEKILPTFGYRKPATVELITLFTSLLVNNKKVESKVVVVDVDRRKIMIVMI